MIHGELQTIELKDGRRANVELLAQYRGFLGYMAVKHSKMFNAACRAVHQGQEDAFPLLEAMKVQKNRDVAAFKTRSANDGIGEARTKALWENHLDEYFYPDYWAELRESQTQVAIRLCTVPTVLSQIFQSVAKDRPLSYKVVNPVKDGAEPRTSEYMWVGSSRDNAFEREIII